MAAPSGSRTGSARRGPRRRAASARRALRRAPAGHVMLCRSPFRSRARQQQSRNRLRRGGGLSASSLPPGPADDERMMSATIHASAVLVGARAALDPRSVGSREVATYTRSHSGRRVPARCRSHGSWPTTAPILKPPTDDCCGASRRNACRAARGARRGHPAARCMRPCAVVGFVVDLATEDAGRLPQTGRPGN